MKELLNKKISSNGLVTYELENYKLFDLIKNKIFESLKLNHDISINKLDEFHKYIRQSELNNIRLNLASILNEDSFASDVIFSNLKIPLQKILGPDLAIQRMSAYQSKYLEIPLLFYMFIVTSLTVIVLLTRS